MLLAILLLLILVAVLADLGLTRPWVLALGVVVAAWVGTTLPDIDLPLGLGHRSGLTHSVLPVAVAGWRRQWRAVAAGLALGVALHLAADLFPNGMRGFARIVLPGLGRLSADESYWWIGVNAALAFAAGVLLVRTSHPPRLALATLGAVAVIGVTYLFRTDGGWWALLLLLALPAVLALWRYGRSSA